MLQLITIIFIGYLAYPTLYKLGTRVFNNDLKEIQELCARIPRLEKQLHLRFFKRARDVWDFNEDGFGAIRGVCNIYTNGRRKYLEGVITPETVNWVVSPSTVLKGSLEHIHEEQWEDKRGTYKAVLFARSVPRDELVTMAINYFIYEPHTCQACESSLPEYSKPEIKVDSVQRCTLDTGAIADSRDRYCAECNAILDRKTGTFYPFYIDHLYHLFVTPQDDPTLFQKYISDLYAVRNIMNVKTEDINIKDHNARAYRQREQHEYTKNIEMFEMWDRLKGLA